MDFYQQKSTRFLIALAGGLALVAVGAYGAISESELAVLAFYGVLIGGGLFLLVYSIAVWRRAN